jgi:DNA-binding transcriptional MerR regulator
MNVINNFYRIGQAANLSGVSAPTIRYYEQAGLIQSGTRSDNDYRVYDDSDIHLLKFVRLCRNFDISLGDVKTLIGLDLKVKRDCNTAKDTLDQHLKTISKKLRELKRLEHELKNLRMRCDGDTDRCKIIEALHQNADSL